jgi:hypothetical protein
MRTVEYKEFIVDLPDGSEVHLTAEAWEVVQMLIKQAMEDENQNPWKRAVVNELVIDGIFSVDHESNPVKAVQDIVSWNCDVVLDPKMSTAASSLVKEGMLKAANLVEFMIAFNASNIPDELRRKAKDLYK